MFRSCQHLNVEQMGVKKPSKVSGSSSPQVYKDSDADGILACWGGVMKKKRRLNSTDRLVS